MAIVLAGIRYPPNTACELRSLPRYRQLHVCNGCLPHRQCYACTQLARMLCRKYHMFGSTCAYTMTPDMAKEELASRLAYEVMFGIVTVEQVLTGKWLSFRLRDKGHTERMRRLWTRASSGSSNFAWVKARG